MRRAALALLLALCSCHKKPDPAHLPEVATVQDFEHGLTVKRWPKTGPGTAALSTDWSADGTRSLKLDAGMMGSFTDLAVSDWTGYGALRFTVHNPGTSTLGLGLEIQDGHEGFDDRHQHSFGAPPGDRVIELDFSGGLWRGEENRPYRGEVKGPIDTAHVTRLAFVDRGEGPLYVDRVELVKVAPLVTPGGFAFDFGRAGKQVMAQTTGVFEATTYTPERGFGLLGPVGSIARAMSYPTPLLGDGLALGDTGFRVDLTGGAYLGVVAFERGGFWEGEQSGYAHAEVRVNGHAVTGHDFTRGAPHFLFEDLELTDLGQIEDRLVRPAHAITRFRFEAAAGANVITVAVTGGTGGAAARRRPPARARHAGRGRVPRRARGAPAPGHRRRVPARGSRAQGPGEVASPAPAGGRAAPGRSAGVPARPPREARGGRPTGAARGHGPAGGDRARAARAERPRGPRRGLAARTGPGGASLPAPLVLHGRYLPMRPLGNGPVWLEVNHFRPDPDFRVGPDLARAVVLEWRVPAGAAPGVLHGRRGLHGPAWCGSRCRCACGCSPSISPPVPIPVGLFRSALPFGPEVLGEDRFWDLQAALLDEQAARAPA